LDDGKPMVVGYFDHTAAWYRRQPQLRVNETVAHVWNVEGKDAIVVLYNDIAAGRVKESTDEDQLANVHRRIEERTADIASYLKAANANGNVKVLLQVPTELVDRWATDTATKVALRDYVKRWSREAALAGFYLYDEPELRGIAVRTLQQIAGVIKQHAPSGRNSAVLSVAYSAVADDKPLLRAYASATPRAFDALLVNRYPIYRAYGVVARAGKGSMGAKLGLTDEKARRENLRDNEFANLDDYFDSIVAAAHVPNLNGRPVYASMQAYGLRDDCAGPACKATKERNPRRSPTWNELLYLFTSVWMSGADGAVLYSHYFSLYDKALRIRLDNLEQLMPGVFRNMPACEPAVILQEVRGTTHSGAGTPDGVTARYAAMAKSGKPDYLVVRQGRGDRASVRIVFDPELRVTKVDELRFDAQGNPVRPLQRSVEDGADGVSRSLRLDMEGFDVKILRLNYE
jgi:hypothetical protein